MQILVLGMHRSGTSMLTRLLQIMGLHIGEAEAFSPADDAHLHQYREHPEVHALNEQLLSALGATWYDVAGLDVNSLDPPVRDAFADRARRIVAGLDARGNWAVKDPRMCLLLPAWLPALTNPVCILIYRHPLRVAQSLRRRDGFPLQVGLALWEVYTLAALRDSADVPVVRVAYTDFVSRPLESSQELARGLAHLSEEEILPVPADRVRAFVRPARGEGEEPGEEVETYLSSHQRRLFQSLRAGEAHAATVSASSRETLESFGALYRELEHLREEGHRWAPTQRRARHHLEHLEQIMAWMSRNAPYAWAEAATGLVRRMSGSPRPSAPSQARKVLAEIMGILDAYDESATGAGGERADKADPD